MCDVGLVSGEAEPHSCAAGGRRGGREATGPAATAVLRSRSASHHASTELAELIGNHPCGTSFNELLVRSHFPAGYSKYVSRNTSGYTEFLNVSRLKKSRWSKMYDMCGLGFAK